MKYFIDTEFIERGSDYPITLLSLAIVAEDGRTFYAENLLADHSTANEWVQRNVIPHLGKPGTLAGMPGFIAEMAKRFVGDDKPEFWGYYADYDWVVFCQLFGAMIDLPKGWPMYCRDIKQLCDERGNPKLPAQDDQEHHALNDARWNKMAYEYLIEALD